MTHRICWLVWLLMIVAGALPARPAVACVGYAGGEASATRSRDISVDSAREPFFGIPRAQPLVAGSLSLAVNGLGQFYNDEPQKGWSMLSGWLIFPVAWVSDALIQGATVRTLAFTLNMGIKVWSVWDAFTVAERLQVGGGSGDGVRVPSVKGH